MDNADLRREVALFFQNPGDQLLFDTVRQDLEFTAIVLAGEPGWVQDPTHHVEQLAAGFGVSNILDSSPEDLSYGEKHRASLAAVLSSPRLKIVLLDEPTRGLDSGTYIFLKSVLFSLKQAGVTVLVTSHDMDFVYEIADRVMAMDQGAIVVCGAPAAVLGNSEARAQCSLAPAAVLEVSRSLNISQVRSTSELAEAVEQSHA